MSNQPIYLFPHKNTATISEVGGKGLSLILSSQAGLPVPPGCILSVSFFKPWFAMLKEMKAWADFLSAEQNTLEKSCNELKQQALKLSFTPQQEQELSETLKQFDKETLFAVRSSSPEEDLEGSSFAGGYETVLGVTQSNIEHAIKKAFMSCLDYRVVVYKQENGFEVNNPKIAVIIQEQIASDVAGVGFSLNPVTNNYDEAVFTANWGLGETVVAGIVTPDTYVVDKIGMKVTNKTLGIKETAIWLQPTGGTKKKVHDSKNVFTLSDNQVVKLTELIKKVEALYNQPIDIEWAFFKQELFLLQARPITMYIPLPSEMITAPGEKKRLYIDLATTLQGLYQPLSITGTSFFTHVMKKIGKMLFFRDITNEITTAIPWISPGRIYGNLSNILKLVGKEKVAHAINIIDPLASKTMQNINENEYISTTNKLKLVPFGFITKMPRISLLIIKARRNPHQTHLRTQEKLLRFIQKASQLAKKEASLILLADKLINLLMQDVLFHTVPLFITGKIALINMKKIAGKELANKLEPLELALPNNVTTEMGLALYHVSENLPPNLSPKEITAGIKNNTLPKKFMSAWNEFLNKYGYRGPMEIDIAAPRYQDNPELLIGILLSMQGDKKHDNPQEKFRKNQEASRKTYAYLYNEIQKRDKTKATEFQKQYAVFETFAGYRETHKLYLVLVTNLLRERILQEGQSLHKAGRLASVEQAFDLTLEELDKAKQDANCNLIATAKKNRKFIDKLSHISHPPAIIDSRGLILRPPTLPVKENEVAGTPISPGIVRGRIKILHTPNEKPFLKGEILVARATDPGWTPLFVNAAAVILEVGGVLQHGALVAREYGLPCVAGIENATTLWKDGTLVEVDGSSGIVNIIKD